MKKLTFIFLLIGSVVTYIGCSDFLEPENKEELTTESFWLNADHATQGIIAAYAPLQAFDGSKWTFFEEMYIGLHWKSDDVLPANTGYGNGIKSFTNGTDDVTFTSFWRSHYTGIFHANQVLTFVPTIENIDEDVRNGILGEGYFLRAYYHFALLNAFGNIAMITKIPETEEDFRPSQTSPEAVWTQIQSDLEEAERLLPDANDPGRVINTTATAYLGKIFLFQEKFNEAIAKFEEVIASNNYDLVANYEDNFNGLNENNEESIFEIQWSQDRSNGNDERHPFDFEVTPEALGGWELYYPSEWLVGEMMNDVASDGSPSNRVFGSIFFDHPQSEMRRTRNSGMATYDEVRNDLLNPTYFKKYANDTDDGFYTGNNINLMRYADLLLMHSEALNEIGMTDESLNLVNLVRARSNAVPLGTMTQTALRQQIRHHERPVELSMEYTIRWFDLYRWSKSGVAAEPVSATLTNHVHPFAGNFVDGKHEIFPIPFFDISRNDNLNQNPGF